MINIKNDSINGIAQVFSSSNEIMSYSGSNTHISITIEERNAQSITKKLQNNIKIKENTNKNHTVFNNKVKEKKLENKNYWRLHLTLSETKTFIQK